MKKILKQSLALASLALVASTAPAGITSTPHNLSTGGTGPNHVTGTTETTGTGQICVFCHTPHASNTTAPAPLWNKALPSTTYTTYKAMNSSTIDGEILGVGSVSAACLSCHDGTQAMDNIINGPGSGGYVSGGSNRTYTWQGAEKITGVANLDADLKNDHPIGIQYCGGGVTGSGDTATVSCKDLDFNTNVKTKSINGNQVFWVDITSANVRSKNDIILYTRTFSAGSGPSVECASCHDPHQDKTSTNSDVNFMRVTTSGSAICLACHNK
jgi:hypothetical protein